MRNQRSTGRGRSVLAPALAGLIALTLAACGGSADARPPTDAPIEDTPTVEVPQATEAAEAPTEEAAAGPTSIDVGREAWFAGFHITFGEATLEQDGRLGDLQLAASFENLGEDESALDATITLLVGGTPAYEGLAMDIPRVPAGTSVDGTFAFSVRDGFSFDDAVLTLGTPAVQQVIVPLTDAAGELVALEPTTLALSGSGTAGQLELTLDGGEVRADRPESHGQMESGKLALTVRYSATNHGDGAADFVFATENVGLRLPDGTEIGPIQDGRSQSIEGVPSGTTARDLATRFEIDDPAAGAYTLLVKAGDAVGEIPLTIP